MIFSHLFRKQYALIAVVILLFVALGLGVNQLLLGVSRRSEPPRPSIVFARMIDQIDLQNPVAGLERLKSWDPSGPPKDLLIVTRDGVVSAPEGRELPFDWASVEKPEKPYEQRWVEEGQAAPGPKSARGVLVKLGGPSQSYLYLASRRGGGGPGAPHFGPGPGNGGPGGPGPGGPGGPTFFMITLGLLVASVLLGVGFALFLLHRSFRGTAALADHVIADLQRGNLKARFPIRKQDEIGDAMSRFNRMADEIERLVERLRSVEHSRMGLLQELTHDLRTPIASLKNLLETLFNPAKELSREIQLELSGLALKEVDYFERLVEDLLVLAEIREPRYDPERAPVSLGDLLVDEAEHVRAHYGLGKKVVLDASQIQGSLLVNGDAHLLRRMIRNAVENAFSFARSQVTVSAVIEGDQIRVRMDDDGPGFPKPVLEHFGERRGSRFSARSSGERLSIGLGSVIMKTVAVLHGGSLQASNRKQGDAIVGATVEFLFPRVGSSCFSIVEKSRKTD